MGDEYYSIHPPGVVQMLDNIPPPSPLSSAPNTPIHDHKHAQNTFSDSDKETDPVIKNPPRVSRTLLPPSIKSPTYSKLPSHLTIPNSDQKLGEREASSKKKRFMKKTDAPFDESPLSVPPLEYSATERTLRILKGETIMRASGRTYDGNSDVKISHSKNVFGASTKSAARANSKSVQFVEEVPDDERMMSLSRRNILAEMDEFEETVTTSKRNVLGERDELDKTATKPGRYKPPEREKKEPWNASPGDQRVSFQENVIHSPSVSDGKELVSVSKVTGTLLDEPDEFMIPKSPSSSRDEPDELMISKSHSPSRDEIMVASSDEDDEDDVASVNASDDEGVMTSEELDGSIEVTPLGGGKSSFSNQEAHDANDFSADELARSPIAGKAEVALMSLPQEGETRACSSAHSDQLALITRTSLGGQMNINSDLLIPPLNMSCNVFEAMTSPITAPADTAPSEMDSNIGKLQEVVSQDLITYEVQNEVTFSSMLSDAAYFSSVAATSLAAAGMASVDAAGAAVENMVLGPPERSDTSSLKTVDNPEASYGNTDGDDDTTEVAQNLPYGKEENAETACGVRKGSEDIEGIPPPPPSNETFFGGNTGWWLEKALARRDREQRVQTLSKVQRDQHEGTKDVSPSQQAFPLTMSPRAPVTALSMPAVVLSSVANNMNSPLPEKRKLNYCVNRVVPVFLPNNPSVLETESKTNSEEKSMTNSFSNTDDNELLNVVNDEASSNSHLDGKRPSKTNEVPAKIAKIHRVENPVEREAAILSQSVSRSSSRDLDTEEEKKEDDHEVMVTLLQTNQSEFTELNSNLKEDVDCAKVPPSSVENELDVLPESPIGVDDKDIGQDVSRNLIDQTEHDKIDEVQLVVSSCSKDVYESPCSEPNSKSISQEPETSEDAFLGFSSSEEESDTKEMECASSPDIKEVPGLGNCSNDQNQDGIVRVRVVLIPDEGNENVNVDFKSDEISQVLKVPMCPEHKVEVREEKNVAAENRELHSIVCLNEGQVDVGKDASTEGCVLTSDSEEQALSIDLHGRRTISEPAEDSVSTQIDAGSILKSDDSAAVGDLEPESSEQETNFVDGESSDDVHPIKSSNESKCSMTVEATTISDTEVSAVVTFERDLGGFGEEISSLVENEGEENQLMLSPDIAATCIQRAYRGIRSRKVDNTSESPGRVVYQSLSMSDQSSVDEIHVVSSESEDASEMQASNVDNLSVASLGTEVLSNKAPLLVKSLDCAVGVSIGDVFLSLLNGKDTNVRSSTEVAVDVSNAVWRMRTMRRCFTLRETGQLCGDPLSYGIPLQGNLPNAPRNRSSLPIDVDNMQVVGAKDQIRALEESARNHVRDDAFDDALELYDEIMEFYKSVFRGRNWKKDSSDDGSFCVRPYFGNVLHNMGIIHFMNRRFQKAQACFEEAVEYRKANNGVLNLDELVSSVKVALCQFALGQVSKAHSGLEICLEAFKVRGANDTDFVQAAEILNNLGCLTWIGGDSDAAMLFFTESLKIQLSVLSRSLYGDSALAGHSLNLSISITRGNMAVLKTRAKDFTGAIVLLERVLASQQLLLYDSHETMLSTMDLLATVNQLAEHTERTRLMLERMLRAITQAHGEDDPRCEILRLRMKVARASIRIEEKVQQPILEQVEGKTTKSPPKLMRKFTFRKGARVKS